MPLKQITLVTLAVCDLCGHTESHASSPASPDAEQHFTDLGWAIITGPLRLRSLVQAVDETGALCPQCSPLLKYAHVPKLMTA